MCIESNIPLSIHSGCTLQWIQSTMCSKRNNIRKHMKWLILLTCILLMIGAGFGIFYLILFPPMAMFAAAALIMLLLGILIVYTIMLCEVLDLFIN